MPVYLDQQPMVVPHDSVAGAIEAARQVAEARGRLVIDVLLDGRRLIDEELHEPSSEPLGARELRFTSAEPRVFVGQALLDAAEELEAVSTHQREAAKQLRAGQLPAAFEHLQAAIDSWQLVRRAAGDGPALLELDPSVIRITIDASTRPLSEHVQELAGDLRTLQNALSIQDWSTISDILSGELEDRAATWRHLLTDLAYQINPHG